MRRVYGGTAISLCCYSSRTRDRGKAEFDGHSFPPSMRMWNREASAGLDQTRQRGKISV